MLNFLFLEMLFYLVLVDIYVLCKLYHRKKTLAKNSKVWVVFFILPWLPDFLEVAYGPSQILKKL